MYLKHDSTWKGGCMHKNFWFKIKSTYLSSESLQKSVLAAWCILRKSLSHEEFEALQQYVFRNILPQSSALIPSNTPTNTSSLPQVNNIHGICASSPAFTRCRWTIPTWGLIRSWKRDIGSLVCFMTTLYGSFMTVSISSWNFCRDDCLITRVFPAGKNQHSLC